MKLVYGYSGGKFVLAVITDDNQQIMQRISLTREQCRKVEKVMQYGKNGAEHVWDDHEQIMTPREMSLLPDCLGIPVPLELAKLAVGNVDAEEVAKVTAALVEEEEKDQIIRLEVMRNVGTPGLPTVSIKLCGHECDNCTPPCRCWKPKAPAHKNHECLTISAGDGEAAHRTGYSVPPPHMGRRADNGDPDTIVPAPASSFSSGFAWSRSQRKPHAYTSCRLPSINGNGWSAASRFGTGNKGA